MAAIAYGEVMDATVGLVETSFNVHAQHRLTVPEKEPIRASGWKPLFDNSCFLAAYLNVGKSVEPVHTLLVAPT